jgi:predicted AAA+ superfamily ATPase
LLWPFGYVNPNFAQLNVSTANKLKKLLYIIAQSVPFKPNFSKLSRDLDVSRNTIPDLIFYLEKAGVLNQLRDDTRGIKLLGKVDKIYLNNTNLAYAISNSAPEIGNIRETVFFSLMRTTQEVTTSAVADFSIGKYTFEVGGKNKGQKQIAGVKDSFIVKDYIEYGYKNILPLWAFGLTY